MRHRLGAVEQEVSDLFVGLLADIGRPMIAGTRLFPHDLTRRDLNPLALARHDIHGVTETDTN